MTQEAPDTGPTVRFRGLALHSAKKTYSGAQRIVPPAETLARVRPSLAIAGITRLANITGLDRIGIPTTLAIRPNGRTLSNSAGKGITLDAAMASAAMEALEIFHAEHFDVPAFHATYSQAEGLHDCHPRELLPLARGAALGPGWPLRWALGWDLLNQREVAVPMGLVRMGEDHDRIHDTYPFHVTSNGLASGNDLLEAINAALFEVIERDALTCWRARERATGEVGRAVRLDSIEHPLARELLAKLDAADVAVILFDRSTDTDVPVFEAYIADAREPAMGVFHGAGAHLDPDIAMARALTEAAQARAVYIAGSRDDMFKRDRLAVSGETNDAAFKRLRRLAAAAPLEDTRAPRATPTFEGDARRLLDTLKERGFERVIIVDLTRPDIPVRVVKAIVPGLEGYALRSYVPGRRALSFARGERG